ncbi:MAG: substrate-binding domain-containing protein [Anaerolineae bacterium]|nr:substrate-binding domain-containing protein [Anaerolineae bacterium]
MLRRSTIVLILFIVVIAGLLGYDRLVRTQPPLEITLAVDPLAETWVRGAVEAFNASQTTINNGTTRVRVNVTTVINDVRVWTGAAGWTAQSHPLLWLPSSSAALQYRPSNLAYTPLVPSLAQTPLVWGGFISRVQVITDDDRLPLDWPSVNAVLAAGTWAAAGATDVRGNVNMALNWPTGSMAGLAALVSGVADLGGSSTISRSSLSGSAYEAWRQPFAAAVRNAQRLGESPAQAMASRGASVADFALLPEAQWLVSLNELLRQERLVFSYPAYQVLLDFPLALWDDASTTDLQRQAAAAFAAYLAGPAGQQAASAAGLRPASGVVDSSATLFTVAAPYGILADYVPAQVVPLPARTEADILLRALE